MKNTYYIIFILVAIFELNAQSYQELQKLKEEYKKALDMQSLRKPADVSEAENRARSTALPDKLIYSRNDIESLLVNTEKLLKQLDFYEDSVNKMPYVGYDIFTKRDSIPFWQNLPLSTDYLLGPGDEVYISLWGESNSYNTETINRDGQIYIDDIGVLNLGGKKIKEAQAYVLSRYSRVYSTLLGDPPKSFIDLTLGELKSINIHFVGYVNAPGVHMVNPFSTVITGLIQAGGVKTQGSLRGIEIIRNNKTVHTIDIYSYLRGGQSFEKFQLIDQDIIHVPARKSTIPISGRVLKPGYYELLENEKISNLLDYSGGRDYRSADYIFIYNNGLSQNSGNLLNYNSASFFSVTNGDSIHVPNVPEFKNYIVIQGQVKNPGKYPFSDKLTLKELIKATMSTRNEDFLNTMDLSKILIFRKNSSGIQPLKLVVDIEDNMVLKNEDHITIPKKSSFEPIESILITGEIRIPGVFAVNNTTTLEDILKLSGGYTENALEGGVEIFRDSLKIGWEKESFFLKDGDSLNVLKKSGIISVRGEINVPGYLTFKKNISIKNYIKKAGGLTAYADKNNIYIIYPNGVSKPVEGWPYPKAKEGSTIFINSRTISSKTDQSAFQTFSMVANQAASIATTVLSLSLIMSQSSNGN